MVDSGNHREGKNSRRAGEAKRAIQEHETWTITGKDAEVFVNALLNPPAPNERMKAAVQRYRERRQEQERRRGSE